MILEEHFDLIVKYLYNYKVVVAASTASKAALQQKGLTPALFLRPFFKAGPRGGEFNLIDVEDYCQPKEKPLFDRMRETLSRSIVNPKHISRESYRTRSEVEDHINNQGFLWFLEAAKLYMDSMSFDYEVTTIDQPMAVVHVMSIDDADFSQEYVRVVKATNELLKQAYKLNPSQYLNLETMVVLLIDRSRERTIEQALRYSALLKEEHRVKSNFICRVEINSPDAEDITLWSSYRRHSYYYKVTLKESDVVRLLTQEIFAKLNHSAMDFQTVVREGIARRIEFLARQYKESSKVANKIFGAFNAVNNDRDKYSTSEVETRELADLYFIERDYKRAYQCYKELSGKFENRNRRLYVSLLEMISHCHVYSKILQLGIKGDPYQQVEKEAKIILDHSSYFIKHGVLLVYSLYVLRTFKKDFLKDVFYPRLKQRFKGEVPVPPLMAFLLEEQYATFHLSFQPVIEYRNYASALLKVGMHFLDAKLTTNAYRCFLIIENIYRGSFGVIEVFVYTYLAKLCMENKNFPLCVTYLRKGWNILSSRISDEKYNQFVKNYEKIAAGLEDAGAGHFLEKEGLTLRFPQIMGVDVSTEDELSDEKLPRMNAHNSKPSGIPSSQTWTEMGAEYFGSDNISKNNNALEYRKLGGFDALTIEQKYLAYRYKPVGIAGRQIDKNARVCFLGERIRVQVWLQNPLNQELELTKCSLKFGEAVMGTDYTCDPPSLNVKLNKNQERIIEYTVVPKRTGMLELTEINWQFNRMLNVHRIPQYSKEGFVNYYFKFNVKQQAGQLRLVAKPANQNVFVGELQRIPIMLINEGTESIDEVTIVAHDERLFGFRLMRTDLRLGPGERQEQLLDICVYDEKCDCFRLLFIYRTKECVRLKRLAVRFTPDVVVQFREVKCEKLSSHMHILTFEMLNIKEQESLTHSINILEDAQKGAEFERLSIGDGFKIIKHEYTKAAGRSTYTFFLQKNPHVTNEVLKLRDTAIDQTSYLKFVEADERLRRQQWANYEVKYYPYDHVDRMNVILLFRYGDRLGLHHPERIATNPKLMKILDRTGRIQDYLLPFNFRIRYPPVVEHNFNVSPTFSVDVEVYIKNIFTENEMHLTVEFIEDEQSQGFWEGISLHELRLKKDQEVLLPIKYVVTDAGLYDLSRIRYVLHKERNKAPIVIMHSIYEHIYLEVHSEKTFTKAKHLQHAPIAPTPPVVPTTTDLL